IATRYDRVPDTAAVLKKVWPPVALVSWFSNNPRQRVNVLIIPDKFKGTLSAGAAAEAIARGWRKSRPHDSLVLLPMSDGGDGFGEVLGRLLGAKIQNIKTIDAAHRTCDANWWWK